MFYFPFKNNFFLRETRDGSRAFSGADQSRRGVCSRVHRRPLTGSTAGITPVLQKARVEWGKKWKEKRLRLRTPNWRKTPGSECYWCREFLDRRDLGSFSNSTNSRSLGMAGLFGLPILEETAGLDALHYG